MNSKIDIEQLLIQRLIFKLNYDVISANMGIARSNTMRLIKKELNNIGLSELDIKNRTHKRVIKPAKNKEQENKKYIDKEGRHCGRNALRKISDEQLIHCFVEEGLTLDEIEAKYGITHGRIGARLHYLLGDEKYGELKHKGGPKIPDNEKEMIDKVTNLHENEGKRFFEIDELLGLKRGYARRYYTMENEIVTDERKDVFDTKGGTHNFVANFLMEVMIRKKCTLEEATEKLKHFYHNEYIIGEAQKLIEKASNERKNAEKDSFLLI